MTRRNDKRSNRRNSRQRNNTPELPPFAQMLFGAIVGKGVDMIAKKMAEIAEEKTPDIHAEGISNQDVTNINNGKASLTKCTIPTDGTAVELPIPDNLQVFISEDGKPMIRKKIEGDEKPTNDAEEGKYITYDDILKELYFDKTAYWVNSTYISSAKARELSYNAINNCTTHAQAKRMIAFNKLQNIAKYLNDGWKPNFEYGNKNWYICREGVDNYKIFWSDIFNSSSVYFKTEELAWKAIRLMGKESLNNLFSTDW